MQVSSRFPPVFTMRLTLVSFATVVDASEAAKKGVRMDSKAVRVSLAGVYVLHDVY